MIINRAHRLSLVKTEADLDYTHCFIRYFSVIYRAYRLSQVTRGRFKSVFIAVYYSS